MPKASFLAARASLDHWRAIEGADLEDWRSFFSNSEFTSIRRIILRPVSLDEVAGQQHILAPGKLLRRAIESDRFSSLIFYGPPGVGKTTLAEVIALRTQARFKNLSGVESNVTTVLS